VQVPPRSVDPARLRAVLDERWGLHGSLEHLPVGYGSHHWLLVTEGGEAVAGSRRFVTVDELGHRPFLGDDPASALASLTAAASAAADLASGAVPEAVAALPDRDGSFVCALDHGHAVWVHPWVVGSAGSFGEPLTDDRRAALLEVLARVHASRVRVPLRRVPLFAESVLLADLLHQAAEGSAPGGWPRRAQDWLRRNRERVVASVEAVGDASRRVAAAPTVVTHGEPHPGNVMWTSDGPRLIDWDTVAAAPRERDVWLAATDAGDVERYEALSGRPVDRTLLRAYDAAWQLSDVASFLDELARGSDRPEDDPDLQVAWQMLQQWSASH
jgi:spectinomycin phosphotransferase